MTNVSEEYLEADPPAGKGKYLTAPLPLDHLPPGIPYIVGNEAAERFSYYGMRTILVVFMTRYLRGADGALETMSEAAAMVWFHRFLFWVYFFPLAGALLCDTVLGKYRTILSLSIVYCFGHLALALDPTRLGLGLGLVLIALGSGGIKPCTAANVGDQFGTRNKHLLERVFSWFYFSINVGAFVSGITTPWLLDAYGPHVAFGVPGVLMLVATLIFWLGRYKFVHIPPGGRQFFRDLVKPDSRAALLKLLPLYSFVAVFWCLYDQSGSAWVLQAEKMNLVVFGYSLKAASIQAINGLLVLLFIPLFSYVVYPAIGKAFQLTPLRKIGIGFVLMGLTYLIPALIAHWLAKGFQPHIAWQVLAYTVLTAAEVMVSVTCLEFSYTQAPAHLKSVVMSVNLLSVAVGNAITWAFNEFVQSNDSIKLSGPNYYVFFAALMLATAAVFVFYARGYREHVTLQEDSMVG